MDDYFGSREVRQLGGNGYYVYHQYPAFACQSQTKPDMVTHTHTDTYTHTHAHAYAYMYTALLGQMFMLLAVLSQFSLVHFEAPTRLTELQPLQVRPRPLALKGV